MLTQAFEVSSKGQDLIQQREVSAFQDLQAMQGLLCLKGAANLLAGNAISITRRQGCMASKEMLTRAERRGTDCLSACKTI